MYSKAMQVATKNISKYSFTRPPHANQRQSQIKPLTQLSDGKIDYCSEGPVALFENILMTLKDYYTSANGKLNSFFIGGYNVDPVAALSQSTCIESKSSHHPYVDLKLGFAKRLTRIASEHDVMLESYSDAFSAWPSLCNPNHCMVNFYTSFNISKHFTWTKNNVNIVPKIRVTHQNMENFRRSPYADSLSNITQKPNSPTQTKLEKMASNGYKVIKK